MLYLNTLSYILKVQGLYLGILIFGHSLMCNLWTTETTEHIDLSQAI